MPPSGDQPAQYQFSDFERSTPLLVMALIFAVVVIVVARWRGFAALLGLGFAGFILVTFMFPALIAGSNLIMVGLIGSAAIMFVALYAAHGFSARDNRPGRDPLRTDPDSGTRLCRDQVVPSQRRCR